MTDDEIEGLARAERLEEATTLAEARGDFARASELAERACDFARASDLADRSGDASRAIVLSARADDEARALALLKKLAHDEGACERAAFILEQRGDHAFAGEARAAIGQMKEAARLFALASRADRAAAYYEQAGEPVLAARALEAELRREPDRADLHFLLGGLLLRFGKNDAALRHLQRVPPGAKERRRALVLLVRALDKLGLGEAKIDAEAELAREGGAEEEEAVPRSTAEPKRHLYGRYEVRREVSSSPSARVLECSDVVRGEHVAVKIFAGYDMRGRGRDALSRFEREVTVLRTLDHPNVVPLRDYLPEGPAIIMPWMEGGSLEDRLVNEPLTPARAVEVASAVLLALGEAHRVGVLHRDVKPANVMFDGAGVTRLSDFGAAHLGDLSATATAGVIGTLAYMSPEQREGRPATVPSDVYGVGAMLWEMLTGQRRSVESADARPSALHRDLDSRHDDAVLAMIADDPSLRPQDAFSARSKLTGLRWPDTIERVAPKAKSDHPPSLRGEEIRLVPLDHGRLKDTWLDADLDAIPVDGALTESLELARAFACAAHPALQSVLKVDEERRAVLLLAPRGAPLTRPLTPAERHLLGQALDALHAERGVHGRLDPEHVRVDPRGHLTVCFPKAIATGATPDLDRLALSRLP